MNHTAKELFTDWYSQGLKRDVSPEEILLRKESIDELLKNDDPVYWIQIVKLFFDKLPQQDQTQDSFVQSFKTKDENFPLKNSNLVRILSGSLLAQKIQLGSSPMSDLIALSVITIQTGQKFEGDIFQEVHAIAENYWILECENVRSMNLDMELEALPAKISTAAIKFTAPEGAEHNQNLQAHATAAAKYLASLSSDATTLLKLVSSVSQSLTAAKTNFEVLSEEVNVLWWILGEYSNVLDKPFKSIDFPLISLVASKELADRTTISPGLGKINNLLNKVFDLSSATISKKIEFEKLVTSYHGQDFFKPLFVSFPGEVSEICPIIYGLYCFSEYGESGWVAVFQKKIDIKPDQKIDSFLLSIRLYQELMLFRVFEETKS